MVNSTTKKERPPVVVVMGHVDHGKSTLLDYIRKSNVVAGEAGGITQHISAYEVTHASKRITFIDTPGHEAFGKMRARGAEVADVSILVVSAEDGVKRQTLEAVEAIRTAGIPFVVAINKIDLPKANIVQTQSSLVENEIYIEGMGGDIPWTAVSSKTGDGINDLLDTILLIAEMEELSGNPAMPANGFVIEAHRNSLCGITATLLIKNGTLKVGDYIVAGTAITPVRAIEDFTGKKLQLATFSSPVGITGFNELPQTGAYFASFENKKGAEKVLQENIIQTTKKESLIQKNNEGAVSIPLVIKTDVGGTLDAIEHELEKLADEHTFLKIVSNGVGSVSERDIQTAISTGALVLAFGVRTDKTAQDVARQHGIEIYNFDIIYKLAEWLKALCQARAPKRQTEQELGEAKLIKIFSENKKTYVIGGKVRSGILKRDARLRVMRRNEYIAGANIINLQAGKQNVEKVEEGAEFGAQIEASNTLVEGDRLKVYEIVEK